VQELPEHEELRKRRRRQASRLRRDDPLRHARVGMSGKIIGWSRA
jgi:hypothetical protein